MDECSSLNKRMFRHKVIWKPTAILSVHMIWMQATILGHEGWLFTYVNYLYCSSVIWCCLSVFIVERQNQMHVIDDTLTCHLC
jgi:hypothetical protein